MMNLENIVTALDNLRDLEDQAQMSALLRALDALSEVPQAAASEHLFRVLERFPESDGYETFWTILHLLEDTPDYENELIRSLRRQPNEFNVLMLSRMLNVGVHKIGEVEVFNLLHQVVENSRTPLEVELLARELIAEHAN